MSLQLTGVLVEIEHVPPFKRDTFERAAFPRLHVLDGRTVYPVDIDPRTFDGVMPAVGARLQIDLSPRSFISRGAATIAWNLDAFRVLDASKPALAKTGS
jgi:hypothetical protein